MSSLNTHKPVSFRHPSFFENDRDAPQWKHQRPVGNQNSEADAVCGGNGEIFWWIDPVIILNSSSSIFLINVPFYCIYFGMAFIRLKTWKWLAFYKGCIDTFNYIHLHESTSYIIASTCTKTAFLNASGSRQLTSTTRRMQKALSFRLSFDFNMPHASQFLKHLCCGLTTPWTRCFLSILRCKDCKDYD